MARSRIDVGNMVCADVSGTGDMMYGIVTERGKRKTTFTPHDGTEPVTISNDEVTKMTKAEYEEATKWVAGVEEIKEVAPKAKPGSLAAMALTKAGVSGDAKSKTQESETEEAEDTSVKLKPDLSNYLVYKDVKTQSNRASTDIGDPVAEYLRGLPLPECYERVFCALDYMDIKTFSKDKWVVSLANLHTRYDHLNPGMQRMNLGNVLRNGVQVSGYTADLHKTWNGGTIESNRFNSPQSIK